nr:hypothetical protein [Saccharomonospora marina]
MNDVMCLAPFRFPTASGEGAADVPTDERAADSARDGAARTPDVQSLTSTAEHNRQRIAVTGHSLKLRHGHVQMTVDEPPADPLPQLIQVSGDQ